MEAATMRHADYGKACYEAFRRYANEHADETHGIPGGYPEWDELPEVCRLANVNAAAAVAQMVRQLAVSAMGARRGDAEADALNLFLLAFTPEPTQ